MENIRARINHASIKHIGQNDDKAMKHPDFNDTLIKLYEDSFYLSVIRNDILIHFKRLCTHL